MNKTYNLLVKFTPDSISNVTNGKIFFNESEKKAKHASFLSYLEYRHAIPDLAETGKIKNEENSIDFSQYKGLVYIKNAPYMSLEELQRLATALRDIDIVEYVEIEPVEPELDPVGPAPTPSGECMSAGPTSTTPNFVDRQSYLLGDSGSNVIGIDAMNAWRLFEATGQGIRCADIENGHFAYDHEDLEGSNFIELVPMPGENTNDHGTAVAGIVFARNNGFGMLGVAYDIDVFYGISQGPLGRVGGIAEGLRHLRAGDVFIYEMQTGGREDRLVPADFNRGVWDITKQATDAGIIVVAAAGNGSEDLDHPFYEEYRSRGDNGSILVGAGTRTGRNRFFFSTYGSPIHLQGWGDGYVATCGVGDLFNEGRTKTYTSLFAGTSAATAVVGAAVIAVQSWFKKTGTVITPRHMRELLIRTGTPQGTGEHIGPLPHIVNAIASQSAVELPAPAI
ncbi:S8 family serine peptidase [Pseudomonas ogarae]|nr:S8 family serine peptidase [Pseudomonas ogarae]AEV63125.1 serine protease, subtilase family [Pseudomonas ogarae]